MNHHQVFCDTLIGHGMKIKDRLFKAIASDAVPLLLRFGPQGYSNLAYTYACNIANIVYKFEGS